MKSQRAWRLVHYLAFPMVGLVTLHGLLAGTESPTPWMRLIYLAVSAIIIWLSVPSPRDPRAQSGDPSQCYSHPDPRRM